MFHSVPFLEMPACGFSKTLAKFSDSTNRTQNAPFTLHVKNLHEQAVVASETVLLVLSCSFGFLSLLGIFAP